LRELRRIGYRPLATRVDSAAAMAAALRDGTWDVVVSDWQIPGFGALAALAVLHDAHLDLPFLIVSGRVDDETAVEALRAGAHDFLVKDRLARLGVAIERERREAEARTERAKMQEQLVISDRMASVGILAAGVAHEINNPLAAVLANLELALQDLDGAFDREDVRRELREEIAEAHAAADRVRMIVRDLRIFSRNGEDRLAPVDVHKVIESTLRMASNEIRHRARVVKKFQPVPLAAASEGRLGQVMLNLVVNAAQALPEGHADKNEIRIATRMAGDRVCVSVADTGSGIPDGVMSQLFKPFVTTKPAGSGTGLGLSICHRIVTELGGEIRVDSSAAGTTFEVFLPTAPRGLEPSVTLPIPVGAGARRGRIITIDDEPMLSRSIERAVSKDHDVVSASSGNEALAMFRDGARFDVILCDLMMPQITGMDLYDELARIAPDQAKAMVFLTGGPFTERARTFLESVPNQRVEKPFEAAYLRALINDLVR
jgi:signal transduction histidine kinase